MDIAVILIVVVIGTNKIVIKIEYFLIKFKGVQKMNNNDDVGIDELLKNVDLGKIQDNSNTKSNTTIGIEFCLQRAQDAVSITFNPLIIISS